MNYDEYGDLHKERLQKLFSLLLSGILYISVNQMACVAVMPFSDNPVDECNPTGVQMKKIHTAMGSFRGPINAGHLTFKVSYKAVNNAWAKPDGTTVFSADIIDKSTPEDFAFYVAHEIAHHERMQSAGHEDRPHWQVDVYAAELVGKGTAMRILARMHEECKPVAPRIFVLVLPGIFIGRDICREETRIRIREVDRRQIPE